VLVAVVVLDLVGAEDASSAWASCATARVIANLIARVLVGELEMALEVGVAGEGVDGAVWDAAGVAALTLTAAQSDITICVCQVEKERRTLSLARISGGVGTSL
jgi:hypothetical protein